MGGWVGGWVDDRKVEENEVVGMSYSELGVGGWVEENEAVQMSYCELGLGEWVEEIEVV